jgi:prepilin-type N-terminal cleavage/methylation domain-containing protein
MTLLTTRRRFGRRGFTLIELLVVTGLIALTAALAMIVAPGIMEKDRTTDAVNTLEGYLQISRSRAQRDKLPRGVRLINAGTLRSTEVQYIESPPVLVVNPDGNGGTAFVEFNYTTAAPATGVIQPGTITDRQCRIRGLTAEQRDQILASVGTFKQPAIWLPVLGTWHRMLNTPAAAQFADGSLWGITVTLDQYPDAALGGATHYRTYHFGIYNPPRPLLGESVMQLPRSTCVDLAPGLSFPAGSSNLDYDILFAPSGQLAFTASIAGAGPSGEGHVFLWVRNQTALQNFTITGASPNFTYLLSDFQDGGEMMIVAIKAKSGAIGAGPVNWPEPTSLTTPAYDPYLFARKAVAGP